MWRLKHPEFDVEKSANFLNYFFGRTTCWMGFVGSAVPVSRTFEGRGQEYRDPWCAQDDDSKGRWLRGDGNGWEEEMGGDGSKRRWRVAAMVRRGGGFHAMSMLGRDDGRRRFEAKAGAGRRRRRSKLGWRATSTRSEE